MITSLIRSNSSGIPAAVGFPRIVTVATSSPSSLSTFSRRRSRFPGSHAWGYRGQDRFGSSSSSGGSSSKVGRAGISTPDKALASSSSSNPNHPNQPSQDTHQSPDLSSPELQNLQTHLQTLQNLPPNFPQPPPTIKPIKYDLTPEQIKQSGGELARLIRDSIRATGPIPLGYYMRLCLGHPIEGYYTKDHTAPTPSSNLFDLPRPASSPTTSTSEALPTDPFGLSGDFITSPEISQVFGELLALFLVTEWVAQGRVGRVRIVELGPGRGTLLDDILRTFAALPTHSSPLPHLESIHLVETSNPLRAQQVERVRKRLEGGGSKTEGQGKSLIVRDPEEGDDKPRARERDEVELSFHEWIGKVPVDKDVFTMVIAHEFFDALPINVFQNTEEGWREVYVNVDKDWTPSSSASIDLTADPLTRKPNSGLTLALSRTSSTLSQILPATSSRFADIPIGSRVEIGKESWEVMRMMGELVEGQVVDRERRGDEESEGEQVDVKTDQKSAGGVGLVVDYGDERAFDNSFRAFRRHEIVHVFDDPGKADLTANVDFAYLKESLEGVAQPHGPMTQRDFLISLGLAPRLDKLLKSAPTKERKLDIANAAKRLIMEDGMGGQYKVMGVTPGWRKGRGVYPFEKQE